jgi:hypothetical protein
LIAVFILVISALIREVCKEVYAKSLGMQSCSRGQMGKAMLLRKQAAFGSEIAGDDA